MPPRATTPGVVAVLGEGAHGNGDDYTYTNTDPAPSNDMEPVAAEVVHNHGNELHALQEEIRQQGERLETILNDRNAAVVAQVIPHEGEDQGGNDEEANVPHPKDIKNTRRNGSKQCFVIGAVLVAVVVALGVILSLVLKPESVPTDEQVAQTAPPFESLPGPTPSPPPAVAPTTSIPSTPFPTARPTPLSQLPALTQLLASASLDGGAALRTPSTPQNMALNWLAGNANLGSYTDQKKIQRFVLATLYFITDGDNWLVRTNWLSDRDECTDWYHDAEGPFCVGGAVGELDFHGNNLAGKIPVELALLSTSVCECHGCMKRVFAVLNFSLYVFSCFGRHCS